MKHLAAAALLFVACGDDHQGRLDAGDGSGDGDATDAEIDADPSVRGPVTVRIIDRSGKPLAGMHAVFIDTDATVTDVVTNASGEATADVYPGASVTAIRARETLLAFSLTTVQSLVPNDTITLISATSAASSADDPFTQRVVPLPSADVATTTKSGGTATFTTVGAHGLAAGDRVIVAGASVVGYNGTWTVGTAPSTTTFTVNLGASGNSTGGSAAKGQPFTISFPSFGGATSYEVHTPCGPIDVGTSTSPQLVLRAGCTSPTMDILVFAKTSGTVEAAYAFQPGVAFTSGGSITITDSWHTLPTLSATLSNPTPYVTNLTLERFTPHLRGIAQSVAMATTSGADVSPSFPVATVGPGYIRTIAACPAGSGAQCISSAIGVAQQTITERVDGASTSYALDIGANLLPWVNAVYLPQTQTLDITVTGTGAFDLFEANLRYVRGQTIYTWRVFGATAQSFTFPALPATLPGDPTIRPTDDQSAYQVYLCESNAINGYRDAIDNVYQALATCESNATPSTIPVGGTKNRLSSWN